MEYDCQLIPIDRISVGFNNFKTPICTNCKNKGCTNPIVQKKISIFGKVMTTRLYDGGYGFLMVSSCEGYQPPNLEEDSEDEDVDLEVKDEI